VPVGICGGLLGGSEQNLPGTNHQQWSYHTNTQTSPWIQSCPKR